MVPAHVCGGVPSDGGFALEKGELRTGWIRSFVGRTDVGRQEDQTWKIPPGHLAVQGFPAGAFPVTEEELEMIKKFAAGGLTDKERKELLPTLIENEQALHDLVAAIKSRQK